MSTKVLNGRAWSKFQEQECAAKTKQVYTYWIEKFLQYTGFKSADNLLDGSVPEIEDRVIAYLASMKERGRATGTMRCALASLSSFYNSNRIALNVKYIGKRIPRRPSRPHRAPTLEELQAIINCADVRGKALVNGLLAPVGLRIGALPSLKLDISAS